MGSLSLVFDPHLPWPVLAAAALVSALAVGWGLWRRARGAGWRLLFLSLLLLALANPVLRREEREPLDDVVVVVKDRSPSQRLADRPAQLAGAEEEVRRRLAAVPGVEVREVEVGGDGRDGTTLFGSLADALAETDPARLGAVLALTDGQAHDAPAADPAAAVPAPFHALLTGREGETDRRLTVEQAPSFAVVDEPQTLTVRVEDDAPASGPVPITLRQDGRVVAQAQAQPGTAQQLAFTLGKAGPTVLEVEAATRQGELTPVNNRAAVTVNGVRDRLRVLLVSGQPYPGLRVWRNLLKADPSVDLVHFTILRPPEKQDGTPIRELALIAFPSRELFEVKLNEFDLIIFDRYSRRGLLPLIYLENIARYVEEGGALLEAGGPEFAWPTSLYRTPLSRVLPGAPSGEVFERGFSPTLTDLGRRHPVTAGLGGGEAPWGRWFRQVDVETGEGEVVMTGVSDRPLLVLKRTGEGRVAQLLSDHAWLWQRGLEGGGPQAVLLRRLVHWLMKEPQLEEEALRARAQGQDIVLERQSLTADPVTATLTAPSGREQAVELRPDSDGVLRARVAAGEEGLYRAVVGEHTAYVTPRPIAPRELADMRATAAVLAPVAEATEGAVRWLAADGVPDLRKVEPGRRAYGRGWLGVRANGAYRVLGTSDTPLLPPAVALFLLVGAAALAWWREGRG
jgi:hypothetical protein